MSNMVPCNNPDVCGVINHRAGTKCRGGFKPAPGSAAAERLSEAQQRVRDRRNSAITSPPTIQSDGIEDDDEDYDPHDWDE